MNDIRILSKDTMDGSWKDEKYWEQKLSLFRSLARPDSGASRGSTQSNQEGTSSGSSFTRTHSICRKYNENRCEETAPHLINGVKVFHICQFCFKRDPIVLDDHPADSCPRKSSGYSRGGRRGGRGRS